MGDLPEPDLALFITLEGPAGMNFFEIWVRLGRVSISGVQRLAPYRVVRRVKQVRTISSRSFRTKGGGESLRTTRTEPLERIGNTYVKENHFNSEDDEPRRLIRVTEAGCGEKIFRHGHV